MSISTSPLYKQPSGRIERRIKQLSPLDIIRLNSLDCVNSPADLVKELIENSLDAGATTLQVFYSFYGYREVAVYDNGVGISGSDNSFEVIANSNSTSKIRTYDEIFSASTYGFRGSSLAWTSLKGELQIFSRCRESEPILRAIYVNGGLLSIVPIRKEDENYVLRSFVGHTAVDLAESFTLMVVSNLLDNLQESEIAPSTQRSELEDIIRRYSVPHYDKEFLLYDTDMQIPILKLERRTSIRDRIFDVRPDIFLPAVAGTRGQGRSASGSDCVSTRLLSRSAVLHISEQETLRSPFYVALQKKRATSVCGLSRASDMTSAASVFSADEWRPGPVQPQDERGAGGLVHGFCTTDTVTKEYFCEYCSETRPSTATGLISQDTFPVLPALPDIMWYSDAVIQRAKSEQTRLLPPLMPALLRSYEQEQGVSRVPHYNCTSPSSRCRSAGTVSPTRMESDNIAAVLSVTVYINNPILQAQPRSLVQQEAIIRSLVAGKSLTNENMSIMLYYNNRPVIMKRLFEELHTCVNSYFKEIHGPTLVLITLTTVQGTCFCDLDRTPEKKFVAFGRTIGHLIQDCVLRTLSAVFTKQLGRRRIRLSEHQRLVAKASMFHDALDAGAEASSHALRLLGQIDNMQKVDPASFLDFDYRLNLFFEKCTKYLYEKIFEGAAGEYHSGVSNLDARAATRHINNNVIVKTIKLYQEEFKTFDPYSVAHRDISREVTNQGHPARVQSEQAPYSTDSSQVRQEANVPKTTLRSDALPTLSARIGVDIVSRVLGCNFKLLRKIEIPAKKNYKALFLSTYLLYGIQYALMKSFSLMRPDLVCSVLQLVPQVGIKHLLKNSQAASLATLVTIFNAINRAPAANQLSYPRSYSISTFQESSDWISDARSLAFKPSSNIFMLKYRKHAPNPLHKRPFQRNAEPGKKESKATRRSQLNSSAPDVHLPESGSSQISNINASVSDVCVETSAISEQLSSYLYRFGATGDKEHISLCDKPEVSATQMSSSIQEASASEPSVSTSSSPKTSLAHRSRLRLNTLTISTDNLLEKETVAVTERDSASENELRDSCVAFNPVLEAEKSITCVAEQRQLFLSSMDSDAETKYQRLRNFTHIFDLKTIRSRFHHLENHVILVVEKELREKRKPVHILGPSPREARTAKKKEKNAEESSQKRTFFTEQDIKTLGKQRMDAMSDAMSTSEPLSLARINSYIQSQRVLMSKADLDTGDFIKIEDTIIAYYNLNNYCCNLNATRITTKVFKILLVKYWLGNAVKTLCDPTVSLHKVPLARVPLHCNIFVETFIDLFLAVGVGVIVADQRAVTVASAGSARRTSVPSPNFIQLLIHPLLLAGEHYTCFKLLFEYNKTAVPTETEFEQLLGKMQTLLFLDHVENPEPTSLAQHKAIHQSLNPLSYGHPIRIEYQKSTNYTIAYSNETIAMFVHLYCEFLAAHFIRVAYEIKAPEITKAFFRLVIEHLEIEDLDTPYKMPIYTEDEEPVDSACA